MKFHKATPQQLDFLYTVLKELHTWDINIDMSNMYRRCMRGVMDSGEYSERDAHKLKQIREMYIKRKKSERSKK